MPIVAWYMLSKESYMKRVMSDVFPTAHVVKNHEGQRQEQKCDPYRFAPPERPACAFTSVYDGFSAPRVAPPLEGHT